MSIEQKFKCDGCGCVEPAGADITKIPRDWRAFTINNEPMHACSLTCGVKVAERKLARLFSRAPSAL